MILTDEARNQIEIAKDFGFGFEGNPNGSIGFVQGEHHVWKCYDSLNYRVWFQTAELIDGYFKNHQKFWSFKEALGRWN